MGFSFNFFGTQEVRKFSYKPRFYDPEKEARRKRYGNVAKQNEIEKEEYKPGMHCLTVISFISSLRLVATRLACSQLDCLGDRLLLTATTLLMVLLQLLLRVRFSQTEFLRSLII